MGKLSTLIIVTMLTVSVSAFFKGKKGHTEPEHYEWSESPKYETIHVEHEPQYEDHYEKSKKDKKWSWLPSWPWKKNKEHSHGSQHKIKHYPLFKIHKFPKGVKVHPVQVIHHTSAPVHQVPQIIYHSSPEPIIHEQHITHSNIIDEIPSPVYQHETIPHEIYHHQVLKEVPAPVYHHEIHNKASPVYHHPIQEEIHEEGSQKWPEIGASQWAQLDSHHSGFEEQSNEEAANEIISSFLGEGHSIDTLEKLMPTLKKDKHLFEKLKQLHHLKSWLPSLKKSGHGHDGKKTLLNFLPKMFHKQSVKHEPQVIETHEHITHHSFEHTAPQLFPTVQHLENYHVSTVPLIPVAIPIHQTVTATVIEHPKKVYQIQHQNEVQNYDHHSTHETHNSYGEPIPNDSYSGASEHNEVVVPPPSYNAEQPYSETADAQSHQEENSIALKSTQSLDGSK